MVKNEVQNIFEDKLSEVEGIEVRLDGVSFHKITNKENTRLIVGIMGSEIKSTMWNRDSSKSSGSNRFNFSFGKNQ